MKDTATSATFYRSFGYRLVEVTPEEASDAFTLGYNVHKGKRVSSPRLIRDACPGMSTWDEAVTMYGGAKRYYVSRGYVEHWLRKQPSPNG